MVGNGSVDALGGFDSRYPEAVTFLTDPDLEAYNALSLVRGMGSVASMALIKSGMRAWKKGFRQGRTQGDPLQQGGVFVITPGGDSLFEQRSQTAGDHADVQEVLDAVRTLQDARVSLGGR